MVPGTARVFSIATEPRGGTTSELTSVETAIIPVAGLGTRMMPLTLGTSKNLLPVGFKPLVQYAVEEALEAGCKKVVIVGGPEDVSLYKKAFAQQKSDALEAKLAKDEDLAELIGPIEEMGAQLEFVIQEEPLGLGHAIYQAHEYVTGGSFAVISPDDLILDGLETPALRSMVGVYQGGVSVAAIEVSAEETKKYGIFKLADGSQNGRSIPAVGMVEKPKENPPSNLAAVGRYILPASIMDVLSQEKRGAGNEVQLTDAIDDMVSSGATSLNATLYEGQRFDCGKKQGFLDAWEHVISLEKEKLLTHEPTETREVTAFEA